MSITIRRIEDIEPYEGEGSIDGIRFRFARQAMDISAWGMNIVELDPHCERYPEHDHLKDGQEELYVVLDGAVTLEVDGTRHRLERGHMVRVPPETTRRLFTEDEGASILALGGTPGRAYPADPPAAG